MGSREQIEVELGGIWGLGSFRHPHRMRPGPCAVFQGGKGSPALTSH